MKRILFCFTIVFCLLLSLQGCKKDSALDQNQQTVNVTLKNNEGYQYDLGVFGDEEGAIITQQAIHYDTSKIDRSFTASTVYRYTPSLGYVGTDEVEIRADRGWNGDSSYNKVVITTIKFTLTN